MQTVARGEFQPSASSIALTSTSISPRSKAARMRASSRLGVSPETASAFMPAALKATATFVRVLHAGAVDDARQVLEAHAVEVRDRGVERPLVEQCGQLFLVEVLVDLALAQRHLRERAHVRAGRDPDAAQRRDHAPAGGLREVEAARLGREEVGDVARDQRAGRRHADEDRALPAPDRGARLLAQRRVRLVADHDRVGVRDVAGVAHEPLVGLDRHRPVGAVLCRAAAAGRCGSSSRGPQLAEELVDEVAAVGEDQRAAGARPSTKPSAATVLPAPVACSNQKRRAAPGSSGCSGSCSSSSSSPLPFSTPLVPASVSSSSSSSVVLVVVLVLELVVVGSSSSSSSSSSTVGQARRRCRSGARPRRSAR